VRVRSGIGKIHAATVHADANNATVNCVLIIVAQWC
jgi:hypothetical protein